MKDIVISILIVAVVFCLLLGLVVGLDAALEGYEGSGFCNLSDGSCYP